MKMLNLSHPHLHDNDKVYVDVKCKEACEYDVDILGRIISTRLRQNSLT